MYVCGELVTLRDGDWSRRRRDRWSKEKVNDRYPGKGLRGRDASKNLEKKKTGSNGKSVSDLRRSRVGHYREVSRRKKINKSSRL